MTIPFYNDDDVESNEQSQTNSNNNNIIFTICTGMRPYKVYIYMVSGRPFGSHIFIWCVNEKRSTIFVFFFAFFGLYSSAYIVCAGWTRSKMRCHCHQTWLPYTLHIDSDCVCVDECNLFDLEIYIYVYVEYRAFSPLFFMARYPLKPSSQAYRIHMLFAFLSFRLNRAWLNSFGRKIDRNKSNW